MNEPAASRDPRAGWRDYLAAVVAVLAVALVGAPLLGHLDLANIAMLFPLAVLFAAIRLGRGPAVVAALLSVALLDFFFVKPTLTLAVADLQYLVTFAVLLAVALITAELAGRLRRERDTAEARGEEAARARLAAESERLRNTLLASLSHDLRTPLTALAGLAESLPLAGPPLPAAQAELAEAIRREALRTHALARDLLDLARLQSDAVTLAREWQLIEEIVASATEASAHALREHRLVVDVAGDLPLVRLDPVLMERVLCNLIDNAVAHTPAGGTIALSARRESDSIEIAVTDTGSGLPRGSAQTLFDRFVRGTPTDGANPAGGGGTGLGLAIVRAIVEAHGGEVRAENRAEGGARFTLRFAVEAQPELPAAAGERA